MVRGAAMNRFRVRLVLLVWRGVLLPAQWIDYRTPGVPRLADGKPNLSAPAPRTPDGKPDFSGIWRAQNPGLFLDLSKGVEGGMIPYRPEIMNLVKARHDDS